MGMNYIKFRELLYESYIDLQESFDITETDYGTNWLELNNKQHYGTHIFVKI